MKNRKDAIRNAISLGGDSDTIACMAGGIAEAFYGQLEPSIYQYVIGKLDEDLKQKMRKQPNDLESETSSDARIRVWEKRLEQHEKLSLEKYAILQEKLNSDYRLQQTMAWILWKGIFIFCSYILK